MLLTSRILRFEDASQGGEVWVNTLTGALDRLSQSEIETVTRAVEGRASPGGEALLEALQSRGYLFESPAGEQAAFERLVSQYQSPGLETHLVLCPTYACNLRCIYCFERLHADLPQQMMGIAAARLVFDAFRQIRSMFPERNYALGLFGGEPLLPGTAPVVELALDQARAEALPVIIITNGVNVNSFLPLLNRYSSIIRALQITLDGDEQTHDNRRPVAGGGGSYRAVIRSVESLLSTGINVTLRVNIDSGNVFSLPGLARLFDRKGWIGNPLFSCNLAPVKDHLGLGNIPAMASESKLLDKLLDVYDDEPDAEELFGFKGFQVLGTVAGISKPGTECGPRVQHCEANYGGFWVAGPDGFLFACPEAVGQPRLALGRYDPGLEIWQEQVDKWVDRSIGSLSYCRKCDIATLCGGGCAYAALSSEGALPSQACEHDSKRVLGIYLKRRILPQCLGEPKH